MYQVEDETRRKVCAMFGKSDEEAIADVLTIKEWIRKQPHLPEIMEENKIRNFLQLNKFNLEKTKEKIDWYYTIRTKVPVFFDNTNPNLPHMQRVFDIAYLFTYPKSLNGMHRVYYAKLKEPNTYTPLQMIALCLHIYEIRLIEDCMVDDIIIMDMDNITFRDLLKVTPRLVANCASVYKNVFSLRLKAMYFLNSPLYVSIWMTILKYILPAKIFGRVQVCRDTQVLKDLFSDEELPKEYGGTGPSLEELTEMMKQKFVEYQDRFDQLDTLRVNEALRPKNN